ncbi:MAG: hypothetical protein ACTSYS_15640 [Promethearchaeota archaeon]
MHDYKEFILKKQQEVMELNEKNIDVTLNKCIALSSIIFCCYNSSKNSIIVLFDTGYIIELGVDSNLVLDLKFLGINVKSVKQITKTTISVSTNDNYIYVVDLEKKVIIQEISQFRNRFRNYSINLNRNLIGFIREDGNAVEIWNYLENTMQKKINEYNLPNIFIDFVGDNLFLNDNNFKSKLRIYDDKFKETSKQSDSSLIIQKPIINREKSLYISCSGYKFDKNLDFIKYSKNINYPYYSNSGIILEHLNMIITFSRGNIIEFRNLADYEILNTFNFCGIIHDIFYLDSNKIIVLDNSNSIYIFDINSNEYTKLVDFGLFGGNTLLINNFASFLLGHNARKNISLKLNNKTLISQYKNTNKVSISEIINEMYHDIISISPNPKGSTMLFGTESGVIGLIESNQNKLQIISTNFEYPFFKSNLRWSDELQGWIANGRHNSMVLYQYNEKSGIKRRVLLDVTGEFYKEVFNIQDHEIFVRNNTKKNYTEEYFTFKKLILEKDGLFEYVFDYNDLCFLSKKMLINRQDLNHLNLRNPRIYSTQLVYEANSKIEIIILHSNLKLMLYDINNKKILMKSELECSCRIFYSKNNSILIFGIFDTYIGLFDIKTGNFLKIINITNVKFLNYIKEHDVLVITQYNGFNIELNVKY